MTHPLLTPRYMVEAPNKQKGELPYPNSPYEVGQIIDFSESAEFKSGNVIGTNLPETFYIDYPHIFRLMHWSEGRELEEMPRWVRLRNGSRRVCEVSEWVKSKSRPNEFYTVLSWGNTGGQFWAHMVNPATEAEYLEYLKSKEK